MKSENIKQVSVLFCAWNKDEIWETDYIVDTIIPPEYVKLCQHIPPHEIEKFDNKYFDVFVYNCRNNTYDFILSCIQKIKPKVVIHLSDEYHYENLNHWNNLANYCELFLRQHHHPGFEYTENTIQMPLGYCNDAGLDGKDIPPITNRCFEWSFLGDMKHDRWHMVNCFNEFMPNNYVDCFVDKKRMIDIYLNSVFVPNGRGNSSLNCFRLYESSMCGSIPVVVGEYDEIQETFKFEENPPWIFCDSWEDASRECYKLLDNKEFLLEKQKEVLLWWENRIERIRTKMRSALNTCNKAFNKQDLKFVLIGANDANDQFLNYFRENNIDFSAAILVEPLESYNEKILKRYENFSNVHIVNKAVMDPVRSYIIGDNSVKFYEHLDSDKISTVKYEHILYHSSYFDYQNIREHVIPRITLKDIFDEYKLDGCDWVAIDAEGVDAEIILTFDWEKNNVSRIEFEHLHLHCWGKAIDSYLTSLGYSQVPALNPEEDVAYENARIIKQKDIADSIHKLKNFPKVHYISVVDDSARRTLLEKKFEHHGISKNNLIPHLFERYDDSKHNVVSEYNNWKLSIGSRGPVTSHLKAIREWYETTDEPYAFFCEDDLSLEMIKYWNFTWTEFFDKLPNDWDCVQLVLLREYLGLFNNGFRNRCWCDWSACAYLITRNHAKNLVENYYPSGDDIFYLDNKSVDLHGREEWAKIPVVETTLFSNFGDGKIYSCPLFVEDVVNCSSSYINLMGFKDGQCDSHHQNSYIYYKNWWIETGQYLSLDELYTY
jgi:FkbM family methyltransferase